MSGFRKLAPVGLSMCLFHIFIGKVGAYEKGPEFSMVVVVEGSDAILPCSLSNKENIEFKLFDWKKDGQKEVFLYDEQDEYNSGRHGQDEQFKGRVSHFPDKLKNGIASIKIQNTTTADSGDYTCDFPRLQPRQTFHIKLVVVELIFKDGSAWIVVAAPDPHIQTLDATDDGVRLKCDVRGAFPEPEVEWQDRAGNILPAEKQVSHRGGHYYITLLTTVAKTDHFRCVVKQDEISHQTEAKTFVFIHEGTFKDRSALFFGLPTGWIVAAVLAILLLLLVSVLGCVLYHKGIIKDNHRKSRWRHENCHEKPSICDHEQGTGLDKTSSY